MLTLAEKLAHNERTCAFLTEPEVAGSYLVEPQEDGTLVLVPEGEEPTLVAIREREGARAATDEEFRRAFGDLLSDAEG